MGELTIPSVAIIITVFNDGRFLDEALGSAFDVQAASEEIARVSILVADDGSTERRTVAVLDRIERRGVPVLRLAHRGLGASRNAALRFYRRFRSAGVSSSCPSSTAPGNASGTRFPA